MNLGFKLFSRLLLNTLGRFSATYFSLKYSPPFPVTATLPFSLARMALPNNAMNSWAEVAQELNRVSEKPLHLDFPTRVRPNDTPELVSLADTGIRVASYRFESSLCTLAAWDQLVDNLPGKDGPDPPLLVRPSSDRNKEGIFFLL